MTRAPENTLAAFGVAVEQGASMIELDVHPTRDGGLVVIHDVTTKRTTGRDAAVNDLTQDELVRLDAGAYTAGSFEGETIPSLEQVLRWAKDRVYLILDIRHYPFVRSYRADRTAERLIRLLNESDMSAYVVVQCLDHLLARRIGNACREVHVGITQHGRPVDIKSLATSAGANVVGLDSVFLTPPIVDSLHAEEIAVMTSVELRLPGLEQDADTTEEVIGRLLEMGVDILVADDVNAARTARTDRSPVRVLRTTEHEE